MCELLAMSANVPTDIRFSFTALAQRGGRTGQHTDGWGIAFYEGKGCRVLLDPLPSAHSELARFVRDYPIKSRIVIAHIRKANRGRVALENTHPFTRELWGRNWTFAHNGQLKGIKAYARDTFTPVGTTDSEHAFCWLMGELRRRFERRPSEARLARSVGEMFARLRTLGVFNAFLSDGETLYASCSTRLCYVERRAPFGQAALIDEDMEVDFSRETTPDDRVLVLASRPLTRNEAWVTVTPQSSLMLKDGGVAGRL